MTIDVDKALANLLRDDAPAERDPLFRVAVLERLERARYRRRCGALTALALALAAIAGVGLAAGDTMRDAAGALLVAAVLVTGYFVLLPAVAQMLGRLRA
jgi:hypothetical protein